MFIFLGPHWGQGSTAPDTICLHHSLKIWLV